MKNTTTTLISCLKCSQVPIVSIDNLMIEKMYITNQWFKYRSGIIKINDKQYIALGSQNIVIKWTIDN